MSLMTMTERENGTPTRNVGSSPATPNFYQYTPHIGKLKGVVLILLG